MSVVCYEELTPKYFKQVIELGNEVHGKGYLTAELITNWAKRGISNGTNANYVALYKHESGIELIGFRLTFAVEHWEVDQWCSPELWNAPKKQCCYFKCNTVNQQYRGLGIGKKLLQLSISSAIKQGAQAGVSHLWKESPNNSAVTYFTHCGGEFVKNHPDKWNEDSKQGYKCTLCGFDCHCEAVEMIIYFDS